MMGGLIRKYTALAWKIVKWLFVISLPLTLLPMIEGTWQGYGFDQWYNAHVDATSKAYFEELHEDIADWGIPGAMSFRELEEQNNAFHTTRLNNKDWTIKLDYHLPQEYHFLSDVGDPATGIDKQASLETLVWTPRDPDDIRKEHWVYMTNFAWPDVDEWDAAFDYIIQYSYAHKALTNHNFSFVQCTGPGGFLCGVWHAKVPSLLHFKVDDTPISDDDWDADLDYGLPRQDLYRVVVRAIDLPLEDSYTGLPDYVFPSPKEQMLAIITGDRLYEQFEPWDMIMQSLTRFGDEISFRRKYAQDTWYYHFSHAYDWYWERVYEPLGLEDFEGYVSGFTFLVSSATTSLARLPVRLIAGAVMSFLGYPSDADVDTPPSDVVSLNDAFSCISSAKSSDGTFDEPVEELGVWLSGSPSPIWLPLTTTRDSTTARGFIPPKEPDSGEIVDRNADSELSAYSRNLKSVEEVISKRYNRQSANSVLY